MTGGMAPRRKGAEAERAVVAWLRDHGYADARRYLAGDGRQPGDVDGVPGVCIEIKNAARFEPSAWLRQAANEAGPNLPVVVAKLRGEVSPGRWVVMLRLEDLMELLADPVRNEGAA